MGNSSGAFRIVVLENATWAVVRTDPARPQVMEVIAKFYDEKRAREYADLQNAALEKPEPEEEFERVEAPAPQPPAAKPEAGPAELSARQSAVLRALRGKMDHNRQVAAKAIDLARAAQIPLGSLHSVLGSLERKGLIELSRGGSARSPAVYRVL